MTRTSLYCDVIQQSRWLIRIISILCLWPKVGETMKKRTLRLMVLHLPTTFLYITLMWVDAITIESIDSAVKVLPTVLTETSLCVKIYTIWKYGPIIVEILEQFENIKIYAVHRQQDLNMWQNAQRQFGYLAKTYIILSMITVYSAFLSVFIKDYNVLPISFWVPYDLHGSKLAFWITYMYEFIAMPITGLANCTLDMLFCYLIYHVSLLYKQLGLRLQQIGHEDKPGMDEFIRQELIKNIRHHQEVYKFCMKCEQIVQNPLLIQIIISTFVICFSIYKLESTNDSSIFLVIAQYIMVMGFQIFLPCYYGSKISSNSQDLLQYIYSSKWTDLSIENRRMILMYMQYLNKPVILRGVNYFNIGLPIFTKVINNAYNLLAVILNVNK